jgi:histidyl-tRNA synthetase
VTQFKAPRGTQDVLPDDQPYWRFVIRTGEELAGLYGYQRIDTPTFEEAALFIHGTGESTDIVSRAMYLFTDRDKRELALRPEATPNTLRAYLEHGLFNQPQPVKLFTIAPAFRYERPQSGRFREHHQFNVEAIGEADAAIDAELIDLLWQFYARLGLTGLVVLLNSIGDANCRPQYVALLRAYYEQHLDDVCSDDRERFIKNPLRMLDCKVPTCQPLIAAAPTIDQHLCQPCSEHFARLRTLLDAFGIPYRLTPRLVRGLDYYTRTVFEFAPEGAGSTGTVGAGGRYDGLMEVIGGKPTPAVGFATGIERIVLNLKKAGVQPPPLAAPRVYVLYNDQALHDSAAVLCGRLRHAGIGALVATGERSIKAQLRAADRSPAEYAYVLDADANACELLDLRHGGGRVQVAPDALADRLQLGA